MATTTATSAWRYGPAYSTRCGTGRTSLVPYGTRPTRLERHRLRSHAVLRSHGSALALSHTSAAIEHGLRLHEPDLSKVHVLCLDKPLARALRTSSITAFP